MNQSATRIIAIGVPKGGTGKTTTTLNLGAALAQAGRRVLLVDFDPQSNLTFLAGLDPSTLPETIFTVMEDYRRTFRPQLRPAIHTIGPGLDIVPTSVLLNKAHDLLMGAVRREEVLKTLLGSVAAEYDYILIDNMPYLGILMLNALTAATEVLIPIEAEALAVQSLQLMLDEVDTVRRSGLNPTLVITGILLTKVERNNVHRDVAAQVREVYGSDVRVFATVIHKLGSVRESHVTRESLLSYDPTSKSAAEYSALATEVQYAEV